MGAREGLGVVRVQCRPDRDEVETRRIDEVRGSAPGERLTERDNHAGLVKVARLAPEFAADEETTAHDADTMVKAAREHDRPAILNGALALHGAQARRTSGQDGDVSEALALLPETDARTENVDRMRARYRLWRATDNAAHLHTARTPATPDRKRPGKRPRGIAARVPPYRQIKTAT